MPLISSQDAVTGFPAQLGADLQQFGTTGQQWRQYQPLDGGPEMLDMKLIEGELWTVHCEPDGAGNGKQNMGSGRAYVHRYDEGSSAWVMVGTEITGYVAATDPRAPSRPSIVYDGTDVWVCLLMSRGTWNASSLLTTYEVGVHMFKWDGAAWTLEQDYWFDDFNSSYGGGTFRVYSSVAPGGEVYCHFGIGDTHVILTSDGDTYTVGSLGNTTGMLVCEADAPMFIYGDTAGSVIHAHDILTDTEISSETVANISDTTVTGTTWNYFIADGLIYVHTGFNLVTLTPDGLTFAALHGDPFYSRPADGPGSGSLAGFGGNMMWDDDAVNQPQIFYVDAPGASPFQTLGSASDIWIFRPECSQPPPTRLYEWAEIFVDALPEVVGSQTQYGECMSVYRDEKIYTLLAFARETMNPTRVMVFATNVCRGCIDCPDIIAAVFRSQLRVGDAAVEGPADLTPPSGNVFTQTPSWRGT